MALLKEYESFNGVTPKYIRIESLTKLYSDTLSAVINMYMTEEQRENEKEYMYMLNGGVDPVSARLTDLQVKVNGFEELTEEEQAEMDELSAKMSKFESMWNILGGTGHLYAVQITYEIPLEELSELSFKEVYNYLRNTEDFEGAEDI